MQGGTLFGPLKPRGGGSRERGTVERRKGGVLVSQEEEALRKRERERESDVSKGGGDGVFGARRGV